MLVESNFVTLLGRHATVTGVKDKTATWNNIANSLNEIGPNKTVKQWNKVIKNLFLLTNTFLAWGFFFTYGLAVWAVKILNNILNFLVLDRSQKKDKTKTKLKMMRQHFNRTGGGPPQVLN